MKLFNPDAYKILIYYCKYFFLNRICLRSRASIMKRQKKLKKVLTHFLCENSKYYALHLSSKTIEQLPMMSKKGMKENFFEINTAGIRWEEAMKLVLEAEQSRNFNSKINNITLGLSSGTSGQRSLFLIHKNEILEYAGRLFSIYPLSFFMKKHRFALFLRSNNNIYTTTGGTIFSFKFFDMLADLKRNIELLQDYQPTLLMGPPSMLCKIAKAHEKKQIKISPIEIYSVAEKLDEEDKAYLERVFNLVIKQLYQTTEGFLGVTCRYGVLHLNEDSILFEKEPVEGLAGAFRPIITDLKRYTQPFVRYRLDDILVERNKPCLCKSPMLGLERIEGRSDDIFYIKNIKNVWVPIFPDYLRREIFLASEHIQDFRAVQMSPLLVHLQILCPKTHETEVESSVATKLAQLYIGHGGQAPVINIQWKLDELGLNKLRRVERRFQVNLMEEKEAWQS